MRTKTALLIALAALALVAAAYGTIVYIWQDDDTLLSSRSDAVFSDYDGKEWKLADFKGSPTVIYVWASWCPYCAAELEALSELVQEYDTLQVVAINRAEPRRMAIDYTSGLSLSPDIVLLLDPDDAFYASVEGHAMPEAVFIDSDGHTMHHQRGPIQPGQMREYVEAITGAESR